MQRLAKINKKLNIRKYFRLNWNGYQDYFLFLVILSVVNN